MNCYLSYQYNTDLTAIRKILNEWNVEYTDPVNRISAGQSIVEKIKDLIEEADFILVLYTQNTNIAFELGMAYQLKKPIFAIVPESEENVPVFLSSMLYLRADFNDLEKISYSLNLFLKNLEKKKPTKSNKDKIPPKRTEHKKLDLPDFDSLSGIELETYVKNLLTQLDLDIVIENQKKFKDFRADFSLWLDELNSTIGNPVIVEVKSRISQSSYKNAINQLTHYIDKSNAKAGLLIYNNPNKIYFERETGSPNIFSIDINELANQLKNKGFGELLVDLRNKSIHKI